MSNINQSIIDVLNSFDIVDKAYEIELSAEKMKEIIYKNFNKRTVNKYYNLNNISDSIIGKKVIVCETIKHRIYCDRKTIESKKTVMFFLAEITLNSKKQNIFMNEK